MGPALAVALAAGVVGCGGGGGGGEAKGGPLVSGGGNSGGGLTNGSSAPTTGGATGTSTGQITTGGTTGSNPTTGTTGSDPTTGTTGSDPTTGTTGTTGSDPTAGSTSAGTTGSDPTTGSASSGTTGSDPTTGGTGGATTGGGTAPTGNLRPNAIYFGHSGDASVSTSILPDGTGRVDEGGLAAGVACAVPDPEQPGRLVYAALSGGRYGVYRGASFSVAASERLAAPTFDAVTALQPTANGDVMVVAESGGTSRVYLLGAGTIQAINEADSAAISVDGTKIAYSKDVGGADDLYLWTRATGGSRRLVTGGDSLYPSFSKDGAWVLFSSNRDGSGDAPWDLYQVASAGGSVERITDTPDISEFGACYNEARTMISTVGVGLEPDAGGVFVVSNAATLRIADDADATFGTYWTSLAGRSRRVGGARFQRLGLRRR